MLHFLFGFSGRINRAKLWAFSFGVVIVQIAAAAVMSFYASDAFFTISFAQVDPEGLQNILRIAREGSPADRIVLAAFVLLNLLMLISWLAVVIKRLHDRDKSMWWIVLLWILPQICGLIGQHLLLGGEQNILLTAPLLVAGAVLGIWGALELYAFSGSPGENRFGPNPLGQVVVNPFSGETAA